MVNTPNAVVSRVSCRFFELDSENFTHVLQLVATLSRDAFSSLQTIPLPVHRRSQKIEEGGITCRSGIRDDR